jgi:hypothetical protein
MSFSRSQFSITSADALYDVRKIQLLNQNHIFKPSHWLLNSTRKAVSISDAIICGADVPFAYILKVSEIQRG